MYLSIKLLTPILNFFIIKFSPLSTQSESLDPSSSPPPLLYTNNDRSLKAFFNITFWCEQARKLLKYVLKESKNVIL